jgi:hypothetical protein
VAARYPRGVRGVIIVFGVSRVDTVIDLEIDAEPISGSYTVHVVQSLAGVEPRATIRLDVGAILAELPALESSILASSVSARRALTPGESAIRSIGTQLFDVLFAGKVGEAYRASVAVAAERGLVPQVTLRLGAPGLAALPWESLFDSEADRYISRAEPLVRRVPAPYTADPVAIDPPLRALGIVSSPRGLPVLDVEGEKERLETALNEQINDGRVTLSWLDDVTWSGLHSKLLQEPWHVLHFIGHGGYDEEADEGLLALVGRDGRADFVSANSLADLLMEAASTPRLVVLNSCESGAAGSSDLFAGTAATLVHRGIHAVVAMQFAVSDQAALAFARSFYVALASGRRIGEAVRSGRIGILGTARNTLEWITPVLYLRDKDARLLDVPRSLDTATGTVNPVGTAATSSTGDTGRDGPSGAQPPRQRRRWPVFAAIVAAVALAGGLVWAILEGGSRHAAETPASDSTGSTTPRILPAVRIAVPADTYWTSTGISCAEGDELTIRANGTVQHSANPNSTVTPDGLVLANGRPDPYYLRWGVPGVPETVATASLIGSIDRQEPFPVGSNATYACPREGELFLGINDVGLTGNSGAWNASIVKTDNPPME